MNENIYEKKSGNKSIYVAIAFAVILVLLLVSPDLIRLLRPTSEEKSQGVNKEQVTSQKSDVFSVSKEEWDALQTKVSKLQEEVIALKSAQTTSNKTAATTSAATNITTSSSTKAISRPSSSNAITMGSYNHDWSNREATLALKNNTEQTVTFVNGRIIYYDMGGNMLDYQDFSKSISIEPGMTKTFSLNGYGYKDNYAYYKSRSWDSSRRYNVKFELKSYK